jgi:hypothetical protein
MQLPAQYCVSMVNVLKKDIIQNWHQAHMSTWIYRNITTSEEHLSDILNLIPANYTAT